LSGRYGLSRRGGFQRHNPRGENPKRQQNGREFYCRKIPFRIAEVE
jgi:hypothetical protein